MSVKSILDIELNDSDFRRFKELFDAYTKQLAETPEAWKKAGKAQEDIATHFAKITAEMAKQKRLEDDEDDEEKQNKRLQNLKQTEGLWSSMARSTGTFARNILHAGESLIKWSGLFGGVTGLLGVGGLWGIDRMAGAVSDQRRSSMGLGLSVGEQKAFDVNFGRFVNPGSFLSGINEAVSNVANQAPLYALGVNPNGSTSDVAVNTLKALRQKAIATPTNQLGLLESMYHLGDIGVGTDDLRRLKTTSPAEFQAQLARYKTDTRGLNINDKTGEAWQNFTSQMERAGATIFKVFVDGLGPLAKPLEHLSEAFTGLVQKLMTKNGPVEKGIDDISKWMTDFAGTLTASDFQKTVDQLVSDTGTIAGAMHAVSEAINHPGEAVVKAVVKDATEGQALRWEGIKSLFNAGFHGLMGFGGSARVEAMERTYGLPKGMLDYVWGKESGRGFLAPDQPGKNGAQGPFQIKPSVGGGADLHSFDGSSERAAQLLALEMRRYGGDVQKAIAAYHLGDPAADRLFQDPNWRKSDIYSKGWNGQMVVTVNNNTGGNAVVSAAALAP